MDSKAASITIKLNGAEAATAARTLADLVADGGYGAGRIATAVNGRFVPVGERATTVLEAGDAIEIVSPRQGG